MNFFLTCAILNFITSTAVFLLVKFNNPKTKTNRYFTYYSLCVAIWGAFQILWIASVSNIEALFYMRIALISSLFIPPTFLHFTCHLIDDYKKNALIIKFCYVFSLAMTTIAFTPLFVKDVINMPNIHNWPLAGKMFILFIFEYIFAISYALKIIYKKLKFSTGTQHQQLKHIFIGILIAYLGGSTNFPLCYKIPLLPFGNILIPVYVIFITYAILKYQLMDINIVIRKSLIYSALISFITLFYFISTYIFANFFKELVGYKSFLFSLISATIIAIVFIPLKDYIQNLIERFLFQGSYVHIVEQNEQLRQEIVQTEKFKAVATLASSLAHEIKNPLTVLQTFNEYLPSKKDDPEFFAKHQNIVPKELDRINNLVHDLLTFAKPSSPEFKQINPNQLVIELISFIEQKCINSNIELLCQLAPDMTLSADPNQLKQALLNILLNAIDAMPNGGQLILKTYKEDRTFVIKITDTGIGIGPEDLKHVFDPFFTKKEKGTGLGLAITKGIIEKHGGKILVKSIVNQGTNFLIILKI